MSELFFSARPVNPRTLAPATDEETATPKPGVSLPSFATVKPSKVRRSTDSLTSSGTFGRASRSTGPTPAKTTPTRPRSRRRNRSSTSFSQDEPTRSTARPTARATTPTSGKEVRQALTDAHKARRRLLRKARAKGLPATAPASSSSDDSTDDSDSDAGGPTSKDQEAADFYKTLQKLKEQTAANLQAVESMYKGKLQAASDSDDDDVGRGSSAQRRSRPRYSSPTPSTRSRGRASSARPSPKKALFRKSLLPPEHSASPLPSSTPTRRRRSRSRGSASRGAIPPSPQRTNSPKARPRSGSRGANRNSRSDSVASSGSGSRADKISAKLRDSTVKPFAFLQRDQEPRESITKRRFREYMDEQKAKEDKELNYRFRPNTIPASSLGHRYDTIMKRQERQRKQVHSKAKKASLASLKPFSFCKRDEERRRQKEAEAAKRREEDERDERRRRALIDKHMAELRRSRTQRPSTAGPSVSAADEDEKKHSASSTSSGRPSTAFGPRKGKGHALSRFVKAAKDVGQSAVAAQKEIPAGWNRLAVLRKEALEEKKREEKRQKEKQAKIRAMKGTVPKFEKLQAKFARSLKAKKEEAKQKLKHTNIKPFNLSDPPKHKVKSIADLFKPKPFKPKGVPDVVRMAVRKFKAKPTAKALGMADIVKKRMVVEKEEKKKEEEARKAKEEKLKRMKKKMMPFFKTMKAAEKLKKTSAEQGVIESLKSDTKQFKKWKKQMKRRVKQRPLLIETTKREKDRIEARKAALLKIKDSLDAAGVKDYSKVFDPEELEELDLDF